MNWHQTTIKLTNDDISSSTAIYCDDDSQISKNMEIPALSSSNENKSPYQEQKNEVSSTNSVDSKLLFQLQTFIIFTHLVIYLQ